MRVRELLWNLPESIHDACKRIVEEYYEKWRTSPQYYEVIQNGGNDLEIDRDAEKDNSEWLSDYDGNKRAIFEYPGWHFCTYHENIEKDIRDIIGAYLIEQMAIESWDDVNEEEHERFIDAVGNIVLAYEYASHPLPSPEQDALDEVFLQAEAPCAHDWRREGF